MTRTPLVASLAASALVSLLAACSSAPMTSMTQKYDQSTLPAAVRVPAGHSVATELVGVGDLTYECREKIDAPGQFAWTLIGPVAVLNDRSGKRAGKYAGPPAVWTHNDASSARGTQLAIAPGGAGNIPLQLVKVDEIKGNGAMSGITFIQRVATKGGVAPALPCTQAENYKEATVTYQADYIFYRAM